MFISPCREYLRSPLFCRGLLHSILTDTQFIATSRHDISKIPEFAAVRVRDAQARVPCGKEGVNL